MDTILYLVRHGATDANLAQPPRLQGRRLDAPLAALGARQAGAARAALRDVPLVACYTSPLLRAVQTATVIAEPHRLLPQVCAALTEGDVGRWEGLSWQDVQQREPEALAAFLADGWHCPYPDGEALADVHARAAPILDDILRAHAGSAILIVAHQVVLRAYLTPLLGLCLYQARQVQLANGSITRVVCTSAHTIVQTLNEVPNLPR